MGEQGYKGEKVIVKGRKMGNMGESGKNRGERVIAKGRENRETEKKEEEGKRKRLDKLVRKRRNGKKA